MDLLSAPANVPSDRALDVPGLVQRTHELLSAGVPLTLLIDLGESAGPRSRQLYAAEGTEVCLLPR